MAKRHHLVAGALMAVVGIGVAVWALYSVIAQTNNSISLKRYARELTKLRDVHGRFPAQTRWKDYWGNPIVYKAEGAGYMLISPGSDGALDVAAYEAKDVAKLKRSTNCFSPRADTIFTERGMVTGCLK